MYSFLKKRFHYLYLPSEKNKIFLKRLILINLLIINFLCNGQSNSAYKKEIGIISDNDLYTSTYYDRYYTNGTFIYYRFATKTKNNLAKKIKEFSLGQKMYTPSPSLSFDPNLQDHPYAGYSFVKFKILDFFKNQSAIKYSIELGVIGPNSKAQEFQEFIHQVYGFENATGWEYQIKNALGLNFELSYLKPLLKNKPKFFDLTSESSIVAGTIITEINTSILGRVNLFKKTLQPFSNSVLFESNLSNDKTTHKELFLFLKPKIGYAIYNASIQGSFLNKKSPVTFGIKPLIVEFETGIFYVSNRWTFKYSANFYKKKHREMSSQYQNYGSIALAYRFN